MITHISQMSLAGKSILLLSRFGNKPVKVKRSMTKIFNQTFTIYNNHHYVFASTTTSIPESIKLNDSDTSSKKDIDKTLRMQLLRKNLDGRGIGSKSPKSRDLLIKDFFNLSKAVTDQKLNVEEFVNSETFQRLQEQVECNIDLMNNGHIISLLASVLKMKIDPSTNLVRLLEHEIKFRLLLFNLNQITKMYKIYSLETSPDRKQIFETLSYRMRSKIQTDDNHLRDLNNILQLIPTNQLPSSLTGLIEERALNMLAVDKDELDDIVNKYISHTELYDYESLCYLFIRLVENKRRPTPLLKAASIALSKMPKVEVEAQLIISTLKALIDLKYRHKPLVTKLIDDLVDVIRLDSFDRNNFCDLFSSIGSLRWRSCQLFEMFIDHVKSNSQDHEVIDHKVISAFLYAAAIVNYKPVDMDIFFKTYLKEQIENKLSKFSKVWLRYVWSLVALNMADEEHLSSVLGEKYYQNFADTALNVTTLSFSDAIRLLNIRAVALHEFKLTKLDCSHLDSLRPPLHRSTAMQKLFEKIQQALDSMVEDPKTFLRHNIATPYGFNIDHEIHLSQEFKIIPLTEVRSFEELHNHDKRLEATSATCNKLAIILITYDDKIVNSVSDEVVGHKRIIARILKPFGYVTAFLSESSFGPNTDSAGVVNKIESVIKDSFRKVDEF